MIDRQTIGDATVYLGDALEISASINVAARLALCDPPYKLTAGGCTDGGMSGKFAAANYNNNGEFVTCDITWAEIAGVIKSGLAIDSEAMVMANDKELMDAQVALAGCGFKKHNVLLWDKRTVTPNRWGMKHIEFAVYVFRGRARALQNCSIKQLTVCPVRAETLHPTEKPIALMRRWIEAATVPGEIVYDPFMGSGTTGVAAVQTGRKFIGFEIERKWFEVACTRLEKALDAPELNLGGVA